MSECECRGSACALIKSIPLEQGLRLVFFADKSGSETRLSLFH